MKKLILTFLSLAVSAFAQAVLADDVTSAVVGQTVTLTVTADGTAPFNYQWKKDAVNITGANAGVFTLANVQLTASGAYTVSVANSAGSVLSPKLTLTVKAPATAPTIITQPKSQSVLVGGSATFSVVAAGTGPLTYQWQKDGVNWAFPNTSATTATFTNPNLQPNDAGVYTCVVTGPGGSVTSSGAILAIVQVTLPSITSFSATVK